MISIEENLKAFPLMSLNAGEYLLTQEEKTDSIYFLLEGTVKITKDGYEVAVVSDKGAVFGEMSILLNSKHSASVQCLEDSKFYHIEHPKKYLEDHPNVIWHFVTSPSHHGNIVKSVPPKKTLSPSTCTC